VSYKVFVDGQEGTTGLQILDRLRARPDIEILRIPDDKRKDPSAKLDLYRQSDVTILCLPDQASREAFELAKNDDVRLIDASTAFRTSPDWVYGLPELCPEQRSLIRNARFVSNCGCHAAGFILALRPLVSAGIVAPDYPVTCHSVTGYSGGGKKLIEVFESEPGRILPTRPYALGLTHKHVPEMQKHAGLLSAPLFTPVLGHFYQGMVVMVPLVTRMLAKKVTPGDVAATLAEYYRGEPFLRVSPANPESEIKGVYLSPTDCNGTNNCDVFVFGHEEQILVATRFDNLGKGASGTAVQNMNLMIGADETSGLV
jgi:N-acetyl-gamma-glutamyl-phosphate reductase